ncbi:obscurin-like protein 1a [Rhinoraja longicauda]
MQGGPTGELESLTGSASESTLSSLRTAPEHPLPPEPTGRGQRSPAWSWAGAAALEEEDEEGGGTAEGGGGPAAESSSRQEGGPPPGYPQDRHLGVEPLVRASISNLTCSSYGSEGSLSVISDAYGSMFSLYRGKPFFMPMEVRQDSVASGHRDAYAPGPMAQRGGGGSGNHLPSSLKARPSSPKALVQPTTPLTPRRKLSTPALYSDTVPAEFQDKAKKAKVEDGDVGLEPGRPLRDGGGGVSPRQSPRQSRCGPTVSDRARYLEAFPERRRSFDLSDGQAWPGFRKARSFDHADTRQARRRTSFSDLLLDVGGGEAGQRRSLFRQKAASFDERPRQARDIELKISEELRRIKRSAMVSPARPVLRSPVLERAVNRELSSRKAMVAGQPEPAPAPAPQRKPLQRALATAGGDHEGPETLGEDGGRAAANHIDRPASGGIGRGDHHPGGNPWPTPGSEQAHPPFTVEVVKKVTLTSEARLPTAIPTGPSETELPGGLKPSSPVSKETLDGRSERADGANMCPRLGLAPLSPAGDPGQHGPPNPRTLEGQEHPKTEGPAEGARHPVMERSARKGSRGRSKKSRPISPELESSDDSYVSAGEDPLEPPLFEIAIADTVVTVGSGALLKCIITGTPMPEVVWRKDGEVVRTCPGQVVKAEGERHTLFILSASPQHAGLYSVTASNEVGLASCCANVHVHTGPAPDPCPQMVPAGLYSPITSDDEYLSPMEELGDLSYKGRQRQPLPDAHHTQTTETRRAVIDTHFKAPPTFEVPLSNQVVVEGDDVSLTVRVLGEPNPIIYWLRNREPVKSDGRHSVLEGEDGRFQLNIAAAQRADAGVYSCKAINEYGTRQCSCKMDVKGRRDVQTLSIVSGVRDVAVNAGESACLECEVRGPPELDVDWLADGKLVQPALLDCKMHFDGNRCRLQLQSVHEDDSGVYTCKLSTGTGEHTSTGEHTCTGENPRTGEHTCKLSTSTGEHTCTGENPRTGEHTCKLNTGTGEHTCTGEHPRTGEHTCKFSTGTGEHTCTGEHPRTGEHTCKLRTGTGEHTCKLSTVTGEHRTGENPCAGKHTRA